MTDIRSTKSLTLPEELVLIALDDDSGSLLRLPPYALEVAVAAAIVMELTLEGRIDTDAERLFLLSPAPTGNALLDESLAAIAARTENQPTAEWLRVFAAPGPELCERVIQGLVARGVLKSVEKRLLWVFKTRVYPPTSGIEEDEVKSRVITLLNNDEIPGPRDALLIGLLRAAGLLEWLLSAPEYDRLRSRIDELATLEETSRALSRTVSEMQLVLATAIMHP